MKKSIVYVKGGIYANKGYHIAKGLSCLEDIKEASNACLVIEGDLNLDDKMTLIPYCRYKAAGGIAVSLGGLATFNDPSILKNEYIEEIDKILRILKIEIPEDLIQIQLKSIYGAVFGNFELFITSFLYTMVLGCELYFDRYLLYINNANYEKNDVYEFVFKDICSINAHNMRKIKNVFENVFEISFPDYTRINKDILKRHDIIHRSGNQKEDNHLKRITLTCDNIVGLINECNMFVDNLLEAMKEPMRKWQEA